MICTDYKQEKEITAVDIKVHRAKKKRVNSSKKTIKLVNPPYSSTSSPNHNHNSDSVSINDLDVGNLPLRKTNMFCLGSKDNVNLLL